jgi:hypothetical protein
MTHDRTGSDRLNKILLNLAPQDNAVLARLMEHRYLQTLQLSRFEFSDRPTNLASLRAAHRVLKRLRQHGLVVMLERTIGGPSRGSTAATWTLTNTGVRLAAIAAGEAVPRRRLSDPSLIFLRHELAVADLHLALDESSSTSGAMITSLQVEPESWRRYLGPLGSITTLKPDLAAAIETTRYDSSYFFEVDRATEPPQRIVAKCLQYQEYYRARSTTDGVLPLIVWVVPTDERRQQLFRHLTVARGIDRRLFRITLLPEIPALVNDNDDVGRLDPGTTTKEEKHDA